MHARIQPFIKRKKDMTGRTRLCIRHNLSVESRGNKDTLQSLQSPHL